MQVSGSLQQTMDSWGGCVIPYCSISPKSRIFGLAFGAIVAWGVVTDTTANEMIYFDVCKNKRAIDQSERANIFRRLLRSLKCA